MDFQFLLRVYDNNSAAGIVIGTIGNHVVVAERSAAVQLESAAVTTAAAAAGG